MRQNLVDKIFCYILILFPTAFIVTKSSTCDTLKTTGREMWGRNFVVSRIICIFAAENVN